MRSHPRLWTWLLLAMVLLSALGLLGEKKKKSKNQANPAAMQMDEQKLPCYPGLSANDSFMPPSLLIGCPIQSCREKTLTSNPISYIDRGDPPFLIMQGKLDCLTPWQQAQELYDALHAAGVAANLVYLPTAQHADDQFNAPPNQAIVDDFLDRNLMGARRRAATPAPAATPSSSRRAAPASR